MNKAEKKFRAYAILVIFVLLTVLLAVINGMNFTMASRDADQITQMIADAQGSVGRGENAPDGAPSQPREKDFRMGPMGPASPEMNASIRYFTFAFPNDGGEGQTVAFNISAVSESDAREWASGLLRESTGWTRGTYRYRVYQVRDMTYVTVIDQGRELLPSYRILLISAVGEVIVLAVGWLVLLAIAKKLYAPIEEADRKQKIFIKNANREFRVPLTVIGANTELAEREHGPDDASRSTRRQLAKMNELVEKLGTVGIFDEEDASVSDVPLSEFFSAAIDREKNAFAVRGLALDAGIEPDVTVRADADGVSRMIDELIANALDYSLTKAVFTLKKESGYVLIEAQNDTTLENGPANEVFDRFTTLENAKDGASGLGLSYVKEIVRSLGGRANAFVSDGTFTLRITL